MNILLIKHFFVGFMVSEIPRVSVFGHCQYSVTFHYINIINISIYKYMFRIYNKHYLYSSICKLCTYNCSLYTFRLNRTFLIPKIRFDHDKFSIRYKGAYLWNSLNTTISSLTNLNTFTIHIKNMLLNSYI